MLFIYKYSWPFHIWNLLIKLIDVCPKDSAFNFEVLNEKIQGKIIELLAILFLENFVAF